MNVGRYVKYKEGNYLVVRDENGLVLLLNPSTNAKVAVSIKNCTVLPLEPLKPIRYKNIDYLVTRFDHIISLRTCKVMHWLPTHKERVDILALAKEL